MIKYLILPKVWIEDIENKRSITCSDQTMVSWYKGQCYSDSICDAAKFLNTRYNDVFILKIDDTNLQQEKFNKEDIINIYSMKEIEHLLILV